MNQLQSKQMIFFSVYMENLTIHFPVVVLGDKNQADFIEWRATFANVPNLNAWKTPVIRHHLLQVPKGKLHQAILASSIEATSDECINVIQKLLFPYAKASMYSMNNIWKT